MKRIAAGLQMAIVIACAQATIVHAAATVFVEEMTWTELRGEIAAGRSTIIVPIGGTEQNGPHMALGKHNARVRVLAERIARELGDALVAPVIAYVPQGGIDPPTAHMRFPGTITVPAATFEQTLESAARSFRLHGFRDVVLIGDHGGYQASMQAVARRLNRTWASTGARVHAVVRYYQSAAQSFPDALKRRGYRDAEVGGHAGLADTSLALAVDPSLVRADRMNDAPRGGDGTVGDPRRASVELGRLGVDAIVAETVDAIRASRQSRYNTSIPSPVR